MIYKDKIYGKIEIKDPLIKEIIFAPSFQRLKGIDQAGYFEPYFPKTSFSRYEHSIGVYILLKKFKVDFKEQVAGLLHDISHTVFSHSVDYALDEGCPKTQSFQDKIFKNFLEKTEIPLILKKYNFPLDFLFSHHNFPLLERPLPELCADRIDYSLRAGFHHKEISFEKIQKFLKDFCVIDKKWVFKNETTAKEFAKLFLKLNCKYFSSEIAAVVLGTTGNLLRYALEQKYISKEDLFTEDKIVIQKIKKYLPRDKKLQILFARFSKKIKFKNNPQNFDYHIFCKSRIVDPFFIKKGQIKKLSQVDKKWKEIIKKELRPKEYFIKFEE